MPHRKQDIPKSKIEMKFNHSLLPILLIGIVAVYSQPAKMLATTIEASNSTNDTNNDIVEKGGCGCCLLLIDSGGSAIYQASYIVMWIWVLAAVRLVIQ
jgi:hypothetical protein